MRQAQRTHLDAVGVVAFLDGGHGDADDALRAGEGGVDREDVRLPDLVRGRVLLQDLCVGGGVLEGQEGQHTGTHRHV